MRGTLIQVVDDVDGRPGARTVRFGLDGREYEVDLTEKNEARLRKELGRYVAAARLVGRPPRSVDSVPPHDPQTVRRWADLFPGRELVERFNSAHGAAG